MNRDTRIAWASIVVIALTVFVTGYTTNNNHYGLTGTNDDEIERRLYVADKSGLSVYDINAGHQYLRKIRLPYTKDYRGIAADPVKGKLYLSSRSGHRLVCVDLFSEKIEWGMRFNGFIDSHAITPDGRFIYLPIRSKGEWRVIDTQKRQVIATIPVKGNPHNTWAGKDGKHMYLAAIGNPNMYVVDTRDHRIIASVGPFKPGPVEFAKWHEGGIRPFAVSADDRYVYVNMDGLLGFEAGDIRTGERLYRAEVQGFYAQSSRHLTPSHGINIHPNQQEIWISNDTGQYIHVFDIRTTPPRQIADIPLSRDNGWVSFSIDGDYAYASSGDVIDTATKKVVARINGSEKLLEIQFRNGKPVRAGTR